MNKRILLVDDDTSILSLFPRMLGEQFDTDTASGGEEGLAKIASNGGYAVVVSDHRMPGMDGIEFLVQVRARSPQTVRALLTGYADVDVALAAVNDASIFRLMTKPVTPELLRKVAEACLRQHRLTTAERGFMEGTLGGGLKILSDILSLVSPAAASRTQRIKAYVRRIAQRLDLPKAWRYTLAAELSQLGCIILPPRIPEKICAGQPLDEAERTMFESHPTAASKLIVSIPRLDKIAQMVARQHESLRESGSTDEPKRRDPVPLGAQLLRVAHDFDLLLHTGLVREEALAELRRQPEEYDPAIVAALEGPDARPAEAEPADFPVSELTPGMILAEDVRDTGGLMVAAEGQVLIPPVLERLQRLERVGWVEGTIRVRAAS